MTITATQIKAKSTSWNADASLATVSTGNTSSTTTIAATVIRTAFTGVPKRPRAASFCGISLSFAIAYG